jgi:DNA-binding XRE family transcriptional regulator
MSIHTRIKKRRIALFSSQEAFAQELRTAYDVKVTWQTIQQWEKEGGTAPNRSRMPAVVAALKTTAEWLLHGTGAEIVDDQGVALQISPITQARPPKWMDEEAYALLEAYYSLNERQRRDALRNIELIRSSGGASSTSNKGQG